MKDLEQFTIDKIKHLTMAINQSAFTAIRDRLIEEKAMAEIALKAIQGKPVGYIEGKAKGTDSFILKGFYRNNINIGDAIYTTPQAAHTGQVIPDNVRDALEKALSAMQFMGDTLNNLDAVCEEDVEHVTPAFEAIRKLLAAAPNPE